MTAPAPDNPIAACRSCGTVLLPGAAFCDRCGAARDSGPAPTRRPAPAWLTRDWPLAAVLALLVSSALLGTCLAYGLGLGALVAGGDGLLPGARAGALLPFAALGGEIAVASGTTGSSVLLLLDRTPLVLTGLAAVVLVLALRRPVRVLVAEPPRARALVAKAGLLLALAVAVAGGFAEVGSVEVLLGDVEPGRQVTQASVSQGRAALGALVLVALVGAVLLVRAGVPLVPRWSRTATRVLLAARAGAAALLVVALVGALAVLVGAGTALDTARDRFALAATSPLTLSGFATAGSAVAHGGAVGVADVEGDISDALAALEEPDEDTVLELGDLELCQDRSEGVDELQDCLDELLDQRRDEPDDEAADALRDALRLSSVGLAEQHVSLADWEVPYTERSGTAPAYAFALLLLPLIALTGATLLLLRRASPPTEGWALGLAGLLGVGYALTSWLLAVLSPLAVSGQGTELSGGLSLLLEPSVGSSLWLPLLWALVVPLVVARLWSRRRGLPGNVLAARPTPAVSTALSDRAAAGDAAARPVGELLTDAAPRRCRSCGTGLVPGASSCSRCGASY